MRNLIENIQMKSVVFIYCDGSIVVPGLLGGGKKKGGWSVALPGCEHTSETNAEG